MGWDGGWVSAMVTTRLLGKIMAHVWIPNFSNRLVLSPIERKVQVVGMAKLMSESQEVRERLERLERRERERGEVGGEMSGGRQVGINASIPEMGRMYGGMEGWGCAK